MCKKLSDIPRPIWKITKARYIGFLIYLYIPVVMSLFDWVTGFGSSVFCLNNPTDKKISINDTMITKPPNSGDLRVSRITGSL